ncbi:hypothetical protein EV363DRAFT_1229118, partial [Boletus edulis]
MYDPTCPMREYPTVSFYDLDSLLKPTSNEASSSDLERAEMLSHKTESYLVAEDADGVEELGEDDMETWLDETQSIQDVEQDTCFEMEHDIDLRAAVVTRVIEQGRPVPEKEMEEASESTVDDGAGFGRCLGLVDSWIRAKSERREMGHVIILSSRDRLIMVNNCLLINLCSR